MVNELPPTEEQAKALAEADLLEQITAPEKWDRVDLSENVLKRVAALASTGATKYAICKQLNISQYHINKIYKEERFKQLVNEIGDDAVIGAKALLRNEMARMAKKASKALEKNLDKHSLEAVKVIFKAMGLDSESEQEDRGKGFTLVLASKPQQEKPIVVVNESKEGESSNGD